MMSRRRYAMKVAAAEEKAAFDMEAKRLRNAIAHRAEPMPPCPHDGIDEFGSEVSIQAFRHRIQFIKDRVQGTKTSVDGWDADAVRGAVANVRRGVNAVFLAHNEEEFEMAAFKRDMKLAKDRVRAARAAQSSFRWISLLLPKRIRDEEIGDALEDVARLLRDPRCPNICRAVRWKIVSTWFWLVMHAVGRIGAAIRGMKAG